IKVGETSKRITRRNQQHEIWVSYSFRTELVRSSTRLELLQSQVDDVIAAMQFPPGYNVKIVHKEQEDYSVRWTMIAAVICVFLLLAGLFEDIGTPICVMATLPLAMAGALWGLVITQTGLANPMVFAGFVMLVGIVVNDAILTLGQSRRLVQQGYSRSRAVLEGGRNRFRPIMMTTATTILAMLPLAIRRGGQSEVWPPFAITIIFGLIASTFFTLGFIPAMYLSLGDIVRWLRSIRAWGISLSLGATAALFYFGFLRAGWVDSWAWRIILTPTAFFTIAALIWFTIKAVTYVKRVSVFQDEDLHITISNLTKHYGADGPLARDLKIKERREAGMRARGESIVNRDHIREDFLWKVPFYGLLIFFHTYFDAGFWRFLVMSASWLALYDLVKSCGMLVEGSMFLTLDHHPSKLRRLFWRTALRVPTLLWIAYFYWELRAQLWITVLFLAIGMFLHWIADIALVARQTGVTPVIPRNFWGMIKRRALSIPIVAGVKPQVHALTGVNLEIGKGMFGLLGPNGAGKTTLMRILCNIYEPTCGCIEINGRNTANLRADVQPILGYLPQHFGLYEDFTIWDYLTYYAMLNDIFEKEERVSLIEKVIRDVNLEDRKQDKISSLSGGMKQRVGIAQTLLHLPKIIVVDEPTAGLDPIERIRFRNLLAELGKDRIVVFSTHITEDVMSACHQLAVLNKGRVVFRGTPEDLVRVADGQVHEKVVDPSEVSSLL
ncbi:MAG: efflux RND transporter permease subunit, partial [Candidatus Hydrogenedentota bacterium]